MMVATSEGYEVLIQDYNGFEAGETVGLRVKPSDIQVMKKERLCNTFEGTIEDESHVHFLGNTFECSSTRGLENGSEVKIKVNFHEVILHDNEEDGILRGTVAFILYKGDHYHLTVLTEENENIFLDTNDIWDDGDRVGISISPESIQIENE
jgi:spermidine/putrescine transport system ATP-binding protein